MRVRVLVLDKLEAGDRIAGERPALAHEVVALDDQLQRQRFADEVDLAAGTCFETAVRDDVEEQIPPGVAIGIAGEIAGSFIDAVVDVQNRHGNPPR